MPDDVAPPLPDLDAVHADLIAVDAALVAIEDGTYGRCTMCGEPVTDEMLAERPLRPRCGMHLDIGG